MKLSECTIGAIVTPKHKDGRDKFHPAYIGHITSFDVTLTDAGCVVIVRVRWCDNIEYSIHPANIELYED